MKTAGVNPRKHRSKTADDFRVTEKDNSHLDRAAERVSEIGVRCWGDPDETYPIRTIRK